MGDYAEGKRNGLAGKRHFGAGAGSDGAGRTQRSREAERREAGPSQEGPPNHLDARKGWKGEGGDA